VQDLRQVQEVIKERQEPARVDASDPVREDRNEMQKNTPVRTRATVTGIHSAALSLARTP
jgi:hypothetical protein